MLALLFDTEYFTFLTELDFALCVCVCGCVIGCVGVGVGMAVGVCRGGGGECLSVDVLCVGKKLI